MSSEPRLPMLYDRRVQGALQLINRKLTPPPGFTQDEFNCQMIVMLLDEIAKNAFAARICKAVTNQARINAAKAVGK